MDDKLPNGPENPGQNVFPPKKTFAKMLPRNIDFHQLLKICQQDQIKSQSDFKSRYITKNGL